MAAGRKKKGSFSQPLSRACSGSFEGTPMTWFGFGFGLGLVLMEEVEASPPKP